MILEILKHSSGSERQNGKLVDLTILPFFIKKKNIRLVCLIFKGECVIYCDIQVVENENRVEIFKFISYIYLYPINF